MKLNLGSGAMIKEGYINYDGRLWKLKDGRHTDVVGKIEDMPFKSESFVEIVCFHVLEHFTYWEAKVVLKTCYDLLCPGGCCIMETPDILGCYEIYVVRRKKVKKYIESLYGSIWKRSPHGEYHIHKFGWTKELLAEEMEKVGFEILKVGVGRSHGMGIRDLRVVGGKK